MIDYSAYAKHTITIYLDFFSFLSHSTYYSWSKMLGDLLLWVGSSGWTAAADASWHQYRSLPIVRLPR